MAVARSIWIREVTGRVLLAMVVCAFLVQAWLIFVQEFNWDEFFYLAHVHDYLRGELDRALQSIHVHLFSPLAGLGTEIDQLIAGRLAMLGFQAVTFVSLYALARTWADRDAAVFAILAYALMPATLQHGASFRTDPFALALTMASLALVARAPLRWWSAIAVGLLAALAALVTVKIIFFAPAFAGVGWWRISGSATARPAVTWLGLAGLAALAGFVLLYLLHQANLPLAGLVYSRTMMEGAADKTLLSAGFFPRGDYLLAAALRSLVQTALLFASVVGLIAALIKRRGSNLAQVGAILACVAPLLCLLFYRNAFPYFIPFITAPAFIAVAWLVMERRCSAGFRAVLGIAMTVTAIPSIMHLAARGQDGQRAVVAAVHRMFPEPVAVIDRNHMIASFPKRGFFMSSWGLQNYQAGEPVFAAVLKQDVVPLLILNSEVLEEAVGWRPQDRTFMPLKDADRAVLQQNFIPHWGPIWVAGQIHNVGPDGTEAVIRIPGKYTVEGGPVVIDGRQVSQGSIVFLSRGSHRLWSPVPTNVTLRWGNRLWRPTRPPPAGPVYRGF